MRLRFLTTLCLLTLGVFALSAINIKLTAGTLRTSVSNPASVVDLTLSGEMNVEDFKFISESMPLLRALNLTDVEIVESVGQAQTGRTVAPAATIPFGSLTGTSIVSVSLPTKGLKAIGECAFASSKLQSIEFPNNAIEIADGAFADCQNLIAVNFKSSASVGVAAFKDCTSLRVITGSENLSKIGDYAFYGCSALSDFSFGSELTTIGTAAFQRSALAAADLSGCSALTSVGAWAFADNEAIESAAFTRSLNTLGEGLFFGCTALQSVKLPTLCYDIPDYTFTNDTALTEADLSKLHINAIGRYALKGVGAMTKLVLPYTLDNIDDNAMESMTSLSEIDVTALYSVPTLGENVWQGIDQSEVLVSANLGTIDEFRSAPQWQNFSYVEREDVITEAIADAATAIKGRFVGTKLIVKVENIEIKQLSLYNIAGTLLATNPGRSETAEFETADYSDFIYIVVATLPDNRTASLKIAR